MNRRKMIFRVSVLLSLTLCLMTFVAGTSRAESRRIEIPAAEPTKDIPVTPGERVALLIGNADYESVTPLSNPSNDIKEFSNALSKVGFEVMVRENVLTNREMDEAVEEFANKLRRKQVGLFYYSGHGLQLNGENYLVPIKAKIKVEKDIDYECFPANKLVRYMDEAKSPMNIVILDACRNNPFKGQSRSIGGGLAKMAAANQMVIAYATDPDKKAEDGDPGKNSPYMKNILKNMYKPGLTIEQFFKEVRKGVLEETGQSQRPWETSCLTTDFSFIPAEGFPAPVSAVETAKPVTETPKPADSPQPSVAAPAVTPSAPAGDEDLIKQTRKAVEGKDWVAAVEKMGTILEKNPTNVNALINRGFAYSNLHGYNKALRDFDKAIEVAPNNAAARNNRGFALLATGDTKGAIADFDKAISVDPQLAAAFHGRGVALFKQGQKEKALADLDKAVELSPKNPALFHNRGLVKQALGNGDAALADFEKAIELAPNNAALVRTRGLCRFTLGDFGAARKDFTRSIEIDPDYAKAFHSRGLVLQKLGDKEKAKEDYVKAKKLSEKTK